MLCYKLEAIVSASCVPGYHSQPCVWVTRCRWAACLAWVLLRVPPAPAPPSRQRHVSQRLLLVPQHTTTPASLRRSASRITLVRRQTQRFSVALFILGGDRHVIGGWPAADGHLFTLVHHNYKQIATNGRLTQSYLTRSVPVLCRSKYG